MKRPYKGTTAGGESTKEGKDDEIIPRKARKDSHLLEGEVMSDGTYLTNDVNRARDPGALKINMDTNMRRETTGGVALIGDHLSGTQIRRENTLQALLCSGTGGGVIML